MWDSGCDAPVLISTINTNKYKELFMKRSIVSMVFIITLVFGLVSVLPVAAQVNMNVDFMSRYVWRGADYGDSPSLQPELSYSSGGLVVGSWAAIPTNTGSPGGYEIDWFASYAIGAGTGELLLMLTDYTFPVPGAEDYFTSNAHFVEGGVEYSGFAGLPLSVFTGMFLTNDHDNSIYFELSYEPEPLGFFIGGTPMESQMYGTSGAAIINAGISAGRTLAITDTFSIDVSSNVILNPYSEDLFFLIGFSL